MIGHLSLSSVIFFSRPGCYESPVNRKQASQKRKNGEHDHFIHAKMILAAPL